MNVNDLNIEDGFQCPHCAKSLRVEELDANEEGELQSDDTSVFTPTFCPSCGIVFESIDRCEMCGRMLRYADKKKGGTFARPCWLDETEPFRLCIRCADKVQQSIVSYRESN